YLGSPRLVVEVATGAIIQRLNYDEFGRIMTDTNPGFQPFGFAGGMSDGDTHLVHFGAREYDPVTGRWTTKGPIGFSGGSVNQYAYCLDDPVSLTDSSGEILPILIGIGAVGGAIVNGLATHSLEGA